MNKVTIDLVGREHYYNDPICAYAVNAELPIDEFIRLLLKEQVRLQKIALDALSKAPRPIIVTQETFDKMKQDKNYGY